MLKPLGRPGVRHMEHANRRYTEEEVTQIIRHALSQGGVKETVSHDDLVEIARSSGISGARLEDAIENMERHGALEAAKAEWIKRHRADFYSHLTSYCIVNSFLLFVNLWTSRGYLWVIWPLAGWGIGLAFHFIDTFWVSEEKIEKGAIRLMKQKRRRERRLERETYEI